MTAFTRSFRLSRVSGRRLLCGLLCLALLLSVCPLPAARADTRYGRVTSGDVNLRAKASTNSDYLFKLPLGLVLPILDTSRIGDVTWYQVEAVDPAVPGSPARAGWIHGDYFYPLTQAEQTAWEKGQSIDGVRPQQGDTNNIEVIGASGRISNGGVNFRTQPSVKSYSMARLERGEVVELLSLPPYDSEDPWYKVNYNGVTGYVQGDYVRVINYGTPVVGPATDTPVPTATPTATPVAPETAVPGPGDPTGTPTATPTPTPYVTPAYETIIGYVKTTQDKVYLRLQPRNPKSDEPRNDIQQVGASTVLPYVAGPLKGTDNDFQWYYVLVGTVHGYLRGDCVTPCNADGSAIGSVTATPTASPTPTPTPTATPTGMTDAPATASPTPTATPAAGAWVKTTLPKVWLRSAPAGRAVEHIPATGTVLTVTGPAQTAANNNYTWYPVITPNGHSGFVRSDCVTPCAADGTPVTTPAPTSVTPPPAAGGHIKTTVPRVFLRSAPGGTAIGQVESTGTVLAFTYAVRPGYSTFTWYFVALPDGRTGFIRGDCAQECDSAGNPASVTVVPTGGTPTPVIITPTPVPTATPLPDYTLYVKTTLNKVWVRRTAGGTAFHQVESRGTVLPFNYISGNPGDAYSWYHVRLADGAEGFIRSDCVVTCDAQGNTGTVTAPPVITSTPTPTPTGVVTPSPTPTATPTPTAPVVIWGYVRVSKTDVAVRSTPGGDDILGRLKLGTFLTCRQAPFTLNGYEWYLCETAYGLGYVRGDCLLEVDEHNATPTPGVTRTPAPTATPSPTPTAPPYGGSYAEYYRLREGDSGTKVRDMVTALKQQGYFKGTVTSSFTTAVGNAVYTFNSAHGLLTGTSKLDRIAWPSTLHLLYGTQPYPAVVTELDITLYPAEKIDWYNGGIQQLFPRGANAKIYDVETGIVWWCHRWAGGSHADIEPLTAADTARLCAIYGVTSAEELEKQNKWERRPCLITIGSRTFACSLYGIGHNVDGDTISDNNFGGQICLHFTNSRTHDTQRVDTDHQNAINEAWMLSPSGHK